MQICSAQVVELTRERDRCKEELDKAQEALNEALLAASPVRKGDIIEDEDKNVFQVSSIELETRVLYHFLQRRKGHWHHFARNTDGLEEQIMAGRIKVVKRLVA